MTVNELPPGASPGWLGWPQKILQDIHSEGLFEVARWGLRLLYTRYREWRIGIQTCGNVYWDNTEIDPACTNYQPIDYASLDFLFDRQEIQSDRDVFLDYGSGKGRVIAVAATHPFKRVIGVEMSAELCATAHQNLDTARGKRCGAVEIIHIDAAAYRVPVEVNVIYFYLPFTGHIFKEVTEQIRISLAKAPRKLSILFLVHDADSCDLSFCEWLTESAAFILPTRKHIRCFLYENNVLRIA